MINISALAAAAAHYDAGDPRRVQHFIKVYGYCRLLGLSEGLDTHAEYARGRGAAARHRNP